jgi:uncharacterized protein (TIGR02246 family)
MQSTQSDATFSQLIEEYETAFNTCDGDIFIGLLTPDFTGYGVSGGLGHGRENAVNSLRSQCEAGTRFAFEMISVDRYETPEFASIAVDISGTINLADGREMPTSLKATLVVVRAEQSEPWRIRHSHLSAR